MLPPLHNRRLVNVLSRAKYIPLFNTAAGQDASAGYSQQLLSQAYRTAPIEKLRRTSDSAEADVKVDLRVSPPRITLDSAITVTSGSSDATTLGEFVAAAGYADVDALGAATSAALANFDDQTGNGATASQSTAASQPLIVEDGVLLEGPTFDGVDDHLRITAPNSTTKPPEATFIFWVWSDTTGSARNLYSTRIAGTVDTGVTIWQTLTGSNIAFDYAGAGGTSGNGRWETNYALSTGEWVHLAFTRVAGSRKLYVNGALQDSTTILDGTVDGATYATLAGREGSGNFDGMIDFFAIYPRELSQSDIQQIMEATDPR